MMAILQQWWPYVIAVIGALWAAYKYFDSERKKRATTLGSTAVNADHGSIAVGTMSGGSIGSPPSPDRKEARE